MSKKVKGFIVTLEEDINEKYAEAIKQALFLIKGVSDVSISNADYDDKINRTRIKNELYKKIFKMLEN